MLAVYDDPMPGRSGRGSGRQSRVMTVHTFHLAKPGLARVVEALRLTCLGEHGEWDGRTCRLDQARVIVTPGFGSAGWSRGGLLVQSARPSHERPALDRVATEAYPLPVGAALGIRLAPAAFLPTLAACTSFPRMTSPPTAPPPGAAFLRGCGDVRLYTSIEGPGTHGVVWFVLGPEAPGRLPYERLTAALHATGFATAVVHARGTGFSDGLRGDLDDHALFLSDHRLFLEHLTERFSRIFLFGQSAGAAFALEAAASSPAPLAGLVLVNPAWKLTYAKGMGPGLRDYFAYAANYVFRRSALTVDMNRSPASVGFAPDREEAEAMQRDPLVVRYFSLRYLLGQRKVMMRCPKNMAAVRAPLLLVQGAHDALVDPTSYDELLRAAQVSDKRKLVAPDGGHGSSAVETMVEPLLEWFVSHADP